MSIKNIYLQNTNPEVFNGVPKTCGVSFQLVRIENPHRRIFPTITVIYKNRDTP